MGLYSGSLANYYGGLETLGGYQFISLDDIINQFMVVYVGEGKILSNVRRSDVQFHAMRGIQELTYDTFRSCKTLELEVPPSLLLPLPHDYVEYTKISWVDSNGKCHTIRQCKSCPKDPLSYKQNDDGTIDVGDGEDNEGKLRWVEGYGESWDPVRPWDPVPDPEKPGGYLYANHDGTADQSDPRNWGPWTYSTDGGATPDETDPNNWGHWTPGYWETVPGSGASYTQDPTVEDSTTWNNLQSGNSDTTNTNVEDYIYHSDVGQRYGLDPQHANINGCFWINCRNGKIYFDSNLAGKTVIIQYISDGLATDDEMMVHKFAEEAMYRHIAWAILNTRANMDRSVVATYKKERSAAVRNAKIRLSSIKLEEITQILRGKSKWIKH